MELRSDEFRIPEHQPSDPNDLLTCSLTVSNFRSSEDRYVSSTGDYESRQLLLGTARADCQSYIYQQHDLVTANISKALGQLRLEIHLRKLWCDAICANQNDNQEKSGQLAEMCSIF